MKPKSLSDDVRLSTDNSTCLIIAGPCSVDEKNKSEIMEISTMTVTSLSGKKQKAIAGTRVVGIKSRTELSSDGKGMGMDYDVYAANLKKLLAGKPITSFEMAPSAKISIDIFEKTGFIIATEVCSPLIQLTPLSGKIPAGKLLPWNPAVNQLGWPLHEMAAIANANHWCIGIKNGKSLGESVTSAESSHHTAKTPLEKVWGGLVAYTQMPKDQVYMIQRGIEAHQRGDYRSMPIHQTARRMKTSAGTPMLFDPSHSLGPKMRVHIAAATIDAMQMKMLDGSYLYDGALIEAGTSSTDTDQHVTLDELRDIVEAVAKFRNLQTP
ncbi:MAG: hypothetical protein WCJ70_03230 [bacterium]